MADIGAKSFPISRRYRSDIGAKTSLSDVDKAITIPYRVIIACKLSVRYHFYRTTNHDILQISVLYRNFRPWESLTTQRASESTELGPPIKAAAYSCGGWSPLMTGPTKNVSITLIRVYSVLCYAVSYSLVQQHLLIDISYLISIINKAHDTSMQTFF